MRTVQDGSGHHGRRRAAAALPLLLAGLLSAPAAVAQAVSRPPPGRPGSSAARPAGTPSRYLPSRFAGRAGRYYRLVWGVDSLSVKLAESGELVRFTWRVLDPEKARVLNDKKAEPSLVDPRAGVSLVVPVVDRVGQLRQSAAPAAGRSYWMAFSNTGQLVKRGDRVSIVVGEFRADGLAVD